MKITASALVVAAGLVGLSAMSASAAVVCNGAGDCWKVRGKPTYGSDLRLHVHPDNWRWKRGENYRWRKVGRGHGYYRDGAWITIRP